MSFDYKRARLAPTLATALTLAVMPATQIVATMPPAELRPMQQPVEVRIPGRRR